MDGPGEKPEAEPTIAQLRRQMTARLAAGGVETPELDARLLLAHALGFAPGDFLSRGETSVPSRLHSAADTLLARRLAGEPVARILGHKEFWSLTFQLSAETLVPRPDTETVVEAVLSLTPDRAAPLRILDLGTGTGAILAAILTERPAATGIAVDYSESAARTARLNFEANGLSGRVAALVADWGTAVAGGFEIMMACDMVFAAEHAMMGLSEVKRGMFAFAGGVQRLAAQVPRATALAMIMTGEPLSAQRLYELGVVTEVLAGDRVLGRALEVTQAMLANSWQAINNGRLLYEISTGLDTNQALALGNAWGIATLASSDTHEGIAAFAHRRRADFGQG